MRKLLAGIAVLALLAACDTQEGPPDPKISNTAQQLVSGVPSDKLLIIVIENKSAAQIKKDAPFTTSLGATYGTGTKMVAPCGHPSKPNYACIALGEKKGITSNSGKTVPGPSIFGNTIKAGRSAKIMAEDLGTDRCRTNAYKKYVPRHVPWVFINTEKPLCEKYVFSYDTYGASDIKAGKLGNVEMLIPNQCNNAHDCSVGTFDKWMKKQWALITAGPDWTSGRLTVVITADEDDKKSGNVIPLIVASPQLSHKVVTTPLTLYSLHRLMAQYGHTAPLANGKTAPDMAVAFGLNVQ